MPNAKKVAVSRRGSSTVAAPGVDAVVPSRVNADDPEVLPEFTDEMVARADWIVSNKKVPISFRIDADVLEFFRERGPGYQSRINAVLRSFMEHARGPKG